MDNLVINNEGDIIEQLKLNGLSEITPFSEEEGAQKQCWTGLDGLRRKVFINGQIIFHYSFLPLSCALTS